MNERQGPATLLGYDEALDLARTIPDEQLRAFIKFGLTTVLTRRGMTPGIDPQADFDLRFFAEALRAMGEHRAVLLRILQGDISVIEWWPDEDKA